MLPPEVAKLPYNKRKQLLALLEAKEDKRRHNKIASLYPNKGELRRELYVKHLEFFESGANYIERLLMAGNRTGKTVAGAYETTLHLTGNYPDWCEGKRFDKPARFWAAGKTSETTRDIVQSEMLGQISDLGSGMIPRDAIVSKSPKATCPMISMYSIECFIVSHVVCCHITSSYTLICHSYLLFLFVLQHQALHLVFQHCSHWIFEHLLQY